MGEKAKRYQNLTNPQSKIVSLKVKGCISQFAKWQIHPFIPRETLITLGNKYETNTIDKSSAIKMIVGRIEPKPKS